MIKYVIIRLIGVIKLFFNILKKFFIFLIISTSQLFSNNLIDVNKKTNLLSNSFIYIDKTKSETINTIKNKKFIKINSSKSLSFGYTPDFIVWIKFTLVNNSSEFQQRVLEYQSPLTTHINLYDKNLVTKEGLFQITPNKKTFKPIFKITLNPKESRTYYLQISSKVTTLIINYNLYHLEDFYHNEITNQNILVFFFSAMFILAIYNLFIYFITKLNSYLFYVLYLLGVSLHQFFYTGYSTLYIQDSYFIELIIKNASLIVAFPIFFFTLFTITFINTKENYPFIYKYLRIYIFIYIIIILFIVLFQIEGFIRNIFSVVLLILILSLTIYSALMKNRQSYFLLIGWSIFFSSMLSMYFASTGIYNIYNDVPCLIELLLVLEAVIFSLALADKIKILQKEKVVAQNNLIEKEKTEAIRLREMVQLKTQELQTALGDKEFLLREVNHRVKNNMQTIISLIRMQKDDVKDPKIKEHLITIQNRFNAMSELHQMLYLDDINLTKISPTGYFESIVNIIKESTYSKDIVVKYNIKTHLNSEEAVYLGLIVNELVTNSIKHAFISNQGIVNINFYNNNNIKTLEVIDNGIGYVPNIQESFGTKLVNSLVEIYLDGRIEIINDNGTNVKISWRQNEKSI